MAVVNCLAREANVLLKGQRGTVDHNGGKAGLNRLSNILERLAVVKMQTRGNDIVLRRAFNDRGDHAVIGKLNVGRGDLEDARHAGLLQSVQDTQGHLHIGRVICGKEPSILACNLDQLSRSYNCHDSSNRVTAIRVEFSFQILI